MCVFEFVYAAASWKIAATENDTNKSGSKSKDKTAQAEWLYERPSPACKRVRIQKDASCVFHVAPILIEKKMVHARSHLCMYTSYSII